MECKNLVTGSGNRRRVDWHVIYRLGRTVGMDFIFIFLSVPCLLLVQEISSIPPTLSGFHTNGPGIGRIRIAGNILTGVQITLLHNVISFLVDHPW